MGAYQSYPPLSILHGKDADMVYNRFLLAGAIGLAVCSWTHGIAAQTLAPVLPGEVAPTLDGRLAPVGQGELVPILAGDPTDQDVATPSDLGPLASVPPSAELSLRPATVRPAAGTATHATAPSAAQAAAVRDVALNSQAPSLRVSTSGPETIVVGQPATYLVTLSSQGEVAAENITVRVALPPGVDLQATKATAGAVDKKDILIGDGRLLWNIEQLPARAEESLSLVLVPQEGRGFDLSVDWSLQTRSSKTPITVQEPKLQLEFAGPDDLVFGETAAWTIAVANPGTGDAQDVNLEVYCGDDKLGSIKVGTLAAGADRTVDLKLQPNQVGAARFAAVAVAQRGLKAESVHAFLVRRGQLQIKLDGPSFEYAGDETLYHVRVGNMGNADAKDVTVCLSLPADTQYQGGLEAVDVSPQGVNWKIDCVAPGTESVFQVRCEFRHGGEQQLVANVSTPDQLSASDSVVTRVQAAADLKLEVLDPKGPRPVGTRTDYEIHVTNRGTDTARKVYVVAICAGSRADRRDGQCGRRGRPGLLPADRSDGTGPGDRSEGDGASPPTGQPPVPRRPAMRPARHPSGLRGNHAVLPPRAAGDKLHDPAACRVGEAVGGLNLAP